MIIISPITRNNYLFNMKSILNEGIIQLDDILYWQWRWKYNSDKYLKWLNLLFNCKSKPDIKTILANSNSSHDMQKSSQKSKGMKEQCFVKRLFQKENKISTISQSSKDFKGNHFQISSLNHSIFGDAYNKFKIYYSDFQKHSRWIKSLSSFLGGGGIHQSKIKSDKLIKKDTNSHSVFDNEIFKLHPDQFSLLNDPELEDLFMLGYSERKLFQTGYKNKASNKFKTTKKNYGEGPLVICLDVSGSMLPTKFFYNSKGQYVATPSHTNTSPIIIGKLLVYELAMYLASNNRKVIINEFSDQIRSFVFESIHKEYDNFFEFWKTFLHGGTDADTALESSLDMIESKSIINADVLVISDMIFENESEVLKVKSMNAKKRGTRIFGINVAAGATSDVDQKDHDIFNKTFSLENEWSDKYQDNMIKKIKSYFNDEYSLSTRV